jgi:hypothetical protein
MKRLLTLLALTCAAASSFAATLNPIQLLNPAGSTAGQAIVSTGPTTAPAWSPVTATTLAPQAANTVVANKTGSVASPTAVAVPNCAGTSSALTYTAGSGFNCNATINALTLGGATFAAPGPIGSTSTSSGAFSSISTPSATIGGGTINNTTIGATAAAAGTFTQVNMGPTNTIGSAVGTSRGIQYFTGNNQRWFQFVNSAAESGSNVGSDWNLSRFSDGGSFIDTPFSIQRSTGQATFLDGLNASGNDALLYQTTAGQSFTSGTAATVATWTKVLDRVNANFNATTGVFTAPAACTVVCYYHIDAGLRFASNSGAITSSVQIQVIVNGSAVAVFANFRTAAGTTLTSVNGGVTVGLTAGQTLAIQGFQNSGGALALDTSPAFNFISIARVP